MTVYYHMDKDGKEWGPFTAGQLTGLLNKGCLNAQSKVRPHGDPKWYKYYDVPHKDAFDETDPDAAEAVLQSGDKLALELEQHLNRNQTPSEPGANPDPPPVAQSIEFCEEFGLVYTGHFVHESPFTGIEIVFAGLGHQKAHVFLPDQQALASHLDAAEDALAQALLAWVLEVHQKMAAEKHYVGAQFQEPLALEVTGAEKPFTVYLLLFTRFMPYKSGHESFQNAELTAFVNGRVVRVAFSYPKFAETIEGNRMLKFAVTATDLLSRTS